MQTLTTVVVLLALVALGALVIHALNGQHDERIAAFHYSRFLPGALGRNHRAQQPWLPPKTPGQTPAPAHRGATHGHSRTRHRPVRLHGPRT
ncbi:hypothetical protein ACFQ2B_16190 [Streptomyces stramineus]|uniref:Secreted protein n=1 Tax=Streptomyces stramineus TaxID=173861 RepID=A0ABP3J8F1_9ACTN